MIPLHSRVYVLIGATLLVVSVGLLIVFVLFKDSPAEAIPSESTIQSASNGDSSTSSITKFPLAPTTTDTAIPVESEEESVENEVERVNDIQELEDVVPTEKVMKETPSPKKATVSFSTAGVLAMHNVARSSVGVGALTWSNSIALLAQKWSDQLKLENCKMRHDPSTPYGENIYWAWSSGASGDSLISDPSEAVNMWVNEESFYNYEKNSCKAGEQCGHYTQVVWENTTEVGCGVSSCTDGDTQTDVWVCRYSPAGNDGSRPF